jgi:hypothetical protein
MVATGASKSSSKPTTVEALRLRRSSRTAPSGSSRVNRTPGSPVSGSVRMPPRAGVGRVRTSTPSTTVTRSPSRAVSPSATLTWYGGFTWAEPPPMSMVSTACRPIRATVPAPSNGSTASRLVSTVMPCAASRVSCSRRAGLSGPGRSSG